MLILLIILAVLALTAAYLLFIPITVYVNVQIDEKTTSVSGVKVFPFEYRFALGKPGAPKMEKPKKEKPKLAEKPEELKPKFKISEISRDDMKTILKVISGALRFVGRLFRSPDQYYMHAALAGGLSAPDLTGEFFGAVQSVRPILPESLSISYKPDFLAEKIHGSVKCGVVIRIFWILYELTLFIFRLPLIKLFKLYRKFKKGG